MTIFVIEDESHYELCGKYTSFDKALEDLEKRAKIPWDSVPNICPCTNWRKCDRNYQIIEYDDSVETWVEKSRTNVLNVSARGIAWSNY